MKKKINLLFLLTLIKNYHNITSHTNIIVISFFCGVGVVISQKFLHNKEKSKQNNIHNQQDFPSMYFSPKTNKESVLKEPTRQTSSPNKNFKDILTGSNVEQSEFFTENFMNMRYLSESKNNKVQIYEINIHNDKINTVNKTTDFVGIAGHNIFKTSKPVRDFMEYRVSDLSIKVQESNYIMKSEDGRLFNQSYELKIDNVYSLENLQNLCKNEEKLNFLCSCIYYTLIDDRMIIDKKINNNLVNEHFPKNIIVQFIIEKDGLLRIFVWVATESFNEKEEKNLFKNSSAVKSII
jgi:hypothetical protein